MFFLVLNFLALLTIPVGLFGDGFEEIVKHELGLYYLDSVLTIMAIVHIIKLYQTKNLAASLAM